ncbi:MAG: GntR family transcriptional regulator [Hyphomicrobiales bacterium]|nr:GntR family transcriptional regulator [Hyphomicrobiales bacterium]
MPAPIRRQVEDGLREMISEGRLTPGDRLVERDLCERLGVSRPLLREAFRQLYAEGLLSNVPGRGTVVSELSIDDARETYEVRARLEAMAAENFARSANETSMAKLEARTRAVQVAQECGDPLALRRAKNDFYEVLVSGCGNAVLGQMLRLLHNRIQLLRTVTLNEPGRGREAAAEIVAIFEAVNGRDDERASMLSALHVRNGQRVMEATFAAHESRKKERNAVRPARGRS